MKKHYIGLFIIIFTFPFIGCGANKYLNNVNTTYGSANVKSIKVIFYAGSGTSGKNVEYNVSGSSIKDSPYGQFEQKTFFAKYDNESIMKDLIGHGNTKGYFFYYIFPKLGVKIYFEDDTANYFLPIFKKRSALLHYANNKISYMGDQNYPKDNQFIYVFQKNKNQSLQQTIRQDHSIFFQQGCATTPIQNFQRRHNKEIINYNNVEAYEMRRAKGNNQCLIDDLGLGILYFVMDKKRPDRYYMISKIDGCGSSCETFTSIEILSRK